MPQCRALYSRRARIQIIVFQSYLKRFDWETGIAYRKSFAVQLSSKSINNEHKTRYYFFAQLLDSYLVSQSSQWEIAIVQYTRRSFQL